MSEEIKERVVKNSLLFFILRDSLPKGTAQGFEYTFDDFKGDEDNLTAVLRNLLDTIDVVDLLSVNSLKNQQLLEDEILRPLNNKMKEIVKKEYYQYLKPRVPKKLHEQILQRDNYQCQYCGADLKQHQAEGFSAQVDHIRSQRAGGKHNPENLLACCWKCNLGKKDYDLFRYNDDPDTDENGSSRPPESKSG